MHFSVDPTELVTHLDCVARAASTSKSGPGALFELNNQCLTVHGAGNLMNVSARLPVSSNTGGFRVGASARFILDACRTLNSNVKFTVTSDQMTLRCRQSRFSIKVTPDDQVPLIKFEQPSTRLKIAETAFKQGLQNTSFAMATNDVRACLNGMLLEVTPDQISLVAADGRCLALHSLALSSPVEGELTKSVVIPRSAVLELQRLLSDNGDELTIELTQEHLRISTSAIVFTTSLIASPYPDYKQIIPRDSSVFMAANTALLRQACKEVSILSDEERQAARFEIQDDSAQLLSSNGRDSSKIQLPLVAAAPGATMTFNVHYLNKVLSVIDGGDNVEFSINSSGQNALIRNAASTNEQYLLTPITR